MAVRPMHVEEVKFMLVLLFLINQDEEGTTYSMVRTMARRYGLNEFNGFLKNAIAREFVEYFKTGEVENYKINEEGRNFYERNVNAFRPALEENYPLQKDITSMLMD